MSSSILDEDYQIFVPDRGEDELDPSMGVLVEEEMSPVNEKYLANSTQVLINFTENEAYFPSDYRVDIEDAKEYVRDVCDDYGLDTPDFYVEIDRREEDPAGASWEGNWNNLFADIWKIFTQDGNPQPLEDVATTLTETSEDYDNQVRADGSGEPETSQSTSIRDAYTRPLGSTRGYDNL